MSLDQDHNARTYMPLFGGLCEMQLLQQGRAIVLGGRRRIILDRGGSRVCQMQENRKRMLCLCKVTKLCVYILFT